MRPSSNLLIAALALGVVTGMRSMLAPAITGRALATRDDLDDADQPATMLASRGAQRFFVPMAAAEMLGDKMPFAPDRTIAPSMLVRALSGGVTAAALAGARRESVWLPALIGASAALIASEVGLGLRKRYGSSSGLVNAALGLAEDCLALSIANGGLRQALGRLQQDE